MKFAKTIFGVFVIGGVLLMLGIAWMFKSLFRVLSAAERQIRFGGDKAAQQKASY